MIFFQVIIKNMVCNMGLLTKKLDIIKINEDVFLGNDLIFEQRFLNKLIEKIEQEIEQEKIEMQSFLLSSQKKYEHLLQNVDYDRNDC